MLLAHLLPMTSITYLYCLSFHWSYSLGLLFGFTLWPVRLCPTYRPSPTPLTPSLNKWGQSILCPSIFDGQHLVVSDTHREKCGDKGLPLLPSFTVSCHCLCTPLKNWALYDIMCLWMVRWERVRCSRCWFYSLGMLFFRRKLNWSVTLWQWLW